MAKNHNKVENHWKKIGRFQKTALLSNKLLKKLRKTLYFLNLCEKFKE